MEQLHNLLKHTHQITSLHALHNIPSVVCTLNSRQLANAAAGLVRIIHLHCFGIYVFVGDPAFSRRCRRVRGEWERLYHIATI